MQRPETAQHPEYELDQKQRLLEVLGGSVPDVVVVLGGGLTKGTGEDKGKKRERTSPYTGMNTNSKPPHEAKASGVRSRSLAAATIAEHFPDKHITFITTGGSSKPTQEGNPYSGNRHSAAVLSHELSLYGKVSPENIRQLPAPTTTATEAMEIMLDAAEQMREGKYHQNYAIIASGYQKPRLQAFLDAAADPEGFEWLLESHRQALSESDQHYLEAFDLLKRSLREAKHVIDQSGVKFTAVSAEDVLTFRGRRWQRIVEDILPHWGPWKNSVEGEVRGVKNVNDRDYVFSGKTLQEYLRAKYPQVFLDTQPMETVRVANQAEV